MKTVKYKGDGVTFEENNGLGRAKFCEFKGIYTARSL